MELDFLEVPWDLLIDALHPSKTLWTVHGQLVRQAGYLLPSLRSVLCLWLKRMRYPPRFFSISKSKHGTKEGL